MERRLNQRFQIKLPMTVRWTSGAAVGEMSTESKNVSSRGVYFFMPKQVKAGSPVEILLTLPHEITLAGPVRVRCLGRVMRNEDKAARATHRSGRGNRALRIRPRRRVRSRNTELAPHCGGEQETPGALNPQQGARYVFWEASKRICCVASLVPQRLHRIQLRRTRRWIKSRRQTHQDREPNRQSHQPPRYRTKSSPAAKSCRAQINIRPEVDDLRPIAQPRKTPDAPPNNPITPASAKNSRRTSRSAAPSAFSTADFAPPLQNRHHQRVDNSERSHRQRQAAENPQKMYPAPQKIDASSVPRQKAKTSHSPSA